MSKFEDLEKKITSVDKEELTKIVTEVKGALEDGNISEKEQAELMKLAKERLGEPFSGFNI